MVPLTFHWARDLQQRAKQGIIVAVILLSRINGDAPRA